jgi:hypothetical protein
MFAFQIARKFVEIDRDVRCNDATKTPSRARELALKNIGAIMPLYVVIRNQPVRHIGGRQQCSLAMRR